MGGHWISTYAQNLLLKDDKMQTEACPACWTAAPDDGRFHVPFQKALTFRKCTDNPSHRASFIGLSDRGVIVNRPQSRFLLRLLDYRTGPCWDGETLDF